MDDDNKYWADQRKELEAHMDAMGKKAHQDMMNNVAMLNELGAKRQVIIDDIKTDPSATIDQKLDWILKLLMNG